MNHKQAIEMLAALAQESRLAVFRRLAAEGTAVTAGNLARSLRIPLNTMSFHLKGLTAAGLLEARRDGRSIFYSLHKKNVSRLMSYLWDDCCGGQPELCGLSTRPLEACATSLVK